MSNLTSHSRALRPALQAARFCNHLILNVTFCTKGYLNRCASLWANALKDSAAILTAFDNNFRTSEAHGTGVLRKYSFTMASLSENPHTGCRNRFSSRQARYTGDPRSSSSGGLKKTCHRGRIGC